MFIIVVREIMGRDKKGKSPWVKARKKDFDEEWRKNPLKRTRARSMSDLRCSPSSDHRQVPPLELIGAAETSLCLEFLLLAGILN